MNIVLLNPKKLKPYAKNPKKHPPEQVDAIAKSIQNFGFDQPIVVDANHVIIKGHGRQLASLQLGLTEVPVMVREDIDLKDAQLLRVLDNHVQSREWETQALRDELLDLKGVGMLDLTGFTNDEIPVSAAMSLEVEAKEFSLETNHKCPACSYRW